MKPLNSQQKKVAALSILVLVVLLLMTAIALPVWLLNRHYDGALDETVNRLDRFARIIGMKDGLQKQAVTVKALEAKRHFLKGGSPSIVAADLQQQAQAVFDANGAKVNSIQPLPSKDEGAYRKVTVQVQLIAPLSAVKGMLYALESAHPYLFVDNFSIRANNMVVTRAEPANEPDLVVMFDLSGYAVKGTP
ncbi:MAG: type II secretion system protein GspM [Rhodoferax sp.]